MPEDIFDRIAPKAQPSGDIFDRVAATSVQPAKRAPTSEEQAMSAAQHVYGAAPAELLNRVKGIARDVGKFGLGAVQYAQYLTGAKVSPTPPFLEPTGDPNEEIGRKVLRLAAPAVIPPGSSLPAQAAIGSTVGGVMGLEGGKGSAQAGAVIGGAAPVVVQGIAEGIQGIKNLVNSETGKRVTTALTQAKSPREAVQATAKAIADRPRDAVAGITQALKPLSTNTDFGAHVQRALPEIKAAESQLERPIETVADLGEGIKIAKKNIWDHYQQIAGPQAQRGVDASPVADAIKRSIPLKLKAQDPKAVAAIEKLADTYRRTFTLGELDEMLTTTNAELNSYYSKYPAAQRVASAANPDIAQNVAEGKALRKLIYDQLDSGGTAVKEIKQTYGSLMNLEKEVQRRLNVAARQNPESLSEQLSRWQAAMKLGKAAITFPARPIGAVGDVASAYAGRTAATALKEANSSDALIANVFRNLSNASPVRPTVPPFQPKALLPAAVAERRVPEFAQSLIPPNLSGVKGSNARLVITPTPADPSQLQIYNSRKGLMWNPNTREFFRYYYSSE